MRRRRRQQRQPSNGGGDKISSGRKSESSFLRHRFPPCLLLHQRLLGPTTRLSGNRAFACFCLCAISSPARWSSSAAAASASASSLVATASGLALNRQQQQQHQRFSVGGGIGAKVWRKKKIEKNLRFSNVQLRLRLLPPIFLSFVAAAAPLRPKPSAAAARRLPVAAGHRFFGR